MTLANKKLVTLTLQDNDVGQILDGLYVRRGDWRYTQHYFEDGYEEPGREIQDCKDADEAKSIADWYDAIIEDITKQLKLSRQKASMVE